MYLELAVLAVFTFLYTLVSGRIEKMPMSGPIVFVAVGFLLGPVGLGWFEGNPDRSGYKSLVDLTLAMILFLDAANSDTSVLRRAFRIPARMLMLGLPGAIGLGFVTAAVLLAKLSLFEAAILGTMLAATDAALGKPVVTNEAVPPRLREGLNVESGLNDGLCVPILLVFIALAHGEGAQGEGAHGGELAPLLLVAQELGIGLGVGLGVAAAGAWLLRLSIERNWVSHAWLQLAIPALAFTCFGVAQTLHGSGYIAAFTGGLLFGYLTPKSSHEMAMAGEGIAEAMAMLTWLLFGAAVVGTVAPLFTWEVIVYSVLSLTVIRILPVYLSLIGMGESRPSRLFLGWFGPRGLASIVFAMMVLNENLPGSRYIAVIVSCTVFISLILHGVTANPLARWIGTMEAESHAGRN